MKFPKNLDHLTCSVVVVLFRCSRLVLAEVRSPRLAGWADWPRIFGGGFRLLGLRPAVMFGGLSDDDVLKLYGDPYHFNRNGQEYFTRLVTPTLIGLYEGLTAK